MVLTAARKCPADCKPQISQILEVFNVKIGTDRLVVLLHPGEALKGTVMKSMLRNGTFALGFLAIAMSLSGPSLAVEPDVDSPAGPELPAPRTDRPDFQQDDGTGQVVDPQAEGAQPRNQPDAIIVPEE